MHKTSVVRIHIFFNTSDVLSNPFILFDLVNTLLSNPAPFFGFTRLGRPRPLRPTLFGPNIPFKSWDFVPYYLCSLYLVFTVKKIINPYHRDCSLNRLSSILQRNHQQNLLERTLVDGSSKRNFGWSFNGSVQSKTFFPIANLNTLYRMVHSLSKASIEAFEFNVLGHFNCKSAMSVKSWTIMGNSIFFHPICLES